MVSPFSQEHYIFRSPLPDIDIPSHLTLPEYVFDHATEYPNKPCIIEHSTGKVYKYEDVQHLSRCMAAGLARIGVNPGDVVMIMFPNCAEFVFLFMGATIRGAAITTANPLYTPTEIHQQLQASNSCLVFTRAANVESLAQEYKPHVRIITVDERREGYMHVNDLLILGPAADNGFVKMKGDDLVALPYSSGTTGLPKGVMLTHSSLITSIAQQVDGENPNLHLSTDDVGLCVLPLIHIFSLNSVMLCGLRAGAAIAILQRSFAKSPRSVKAAGSCGTVVKNAEMKIVDVETAASFGEICILGSRF